LPHKSAKCKLSHGPATLTIPVLLCCDLFFVFVFLRRNFVSGIIVVTSSLLIGAKRASTAATEHFQKSVVQLRDHLELTFNLYTDDHSRRTREVTQSEEERISKRSTHVSLLPGLKPQRSTHAGSEDQGTYLELRNDISPSTSPGTSPDSSLKETEDLLVESVSFAPTIAESRPVVSVDHARHVEFLDRESASKNDVLVTRGAFEMGKSSRHRRSGGGGMRADLAVHLRPDQYTGAVRRGHPTPGSLPRAKLSTEGNGFHVRFSVIKQSARTIIRKVLARVVLRVRPGARQNKHTDRQEVCLVG